MTLEEAIDLIKEKSRRSIQCDCPDCQAQKVLLAAYEETEAELDRWRKRNDGHACPRCGSPSIQCYYTAPPQYQCSACGAKLIDDNTGPAIPVLTKEQAESKRPGMYGLPTCDRCSHAPHDGICKETCDHCKPGPPHIYKFRVAQ